jgi:hypothetical protein
MVVDMSATGLGGGVELSHAASSMDAVVRNRTERFIRKHLAVELGSGNITTIVAGNTVSLFGTVIE